MSATKLLLSAVVLLGSGLASHAGPCTSAIDVMQRRLDAKIEAVAGAMPFAKESAAAKLNRQPTPGSIAAAEAKLGAGKEMQQAVAALDRARSADAAGDKASCEQALAEVEHALAQ